MNAPRILRWSRTDYLICALLGLGALLVRLPELATLPTFRDELAEVLRGLHIYRGLDFPLTNEALDIGALFNYMVAAAFFLTGPNPYIPRLLVTLLGAATVVITYALAWRLTLSRPVAFVAAALLASNAMHIFIGHIAWSNCTTPFWTAALLLALTPAMPTGLPRRRTLLGAGVLAGLALQSHSSVIAFLAGVAICIWWPGKTLRDRLRQPAFWGAHLLFLVAYGNMIVFNILNPLASWDFVVEHKAYALAGADAAGTVGIGSGYFENLAALLVEWLRANSADFTVHDTQLQYLADPLLLLYGALLVGGIALALRARYWILLAPAASVALILPLFNRDYGFEIHTRYIGFLLPIGAVLMALPFGWLWQRLASVTPAFLRQAPLAVTALLVAFPLFPLYSYYGEELAAGRSNVAVIGVLDTLKPLGRTGAAAYTSKLPVALSIGLGLDLLEIPHLELTDNNEPTLPPGEGGLDTPAVWRAFVEWASALPPGTSELAMALPPQGAASWRSIGGALPWGEPQLVTDSANQPAVAVLRLPMSAGDFAKSPEAQLATDLLIVVPRLDDAPKERVAAELAAGKSVRLMVLDGAEAKAEGIAALGLAPDRVMLGGYPAAYLASIAPQANNPDPEQPWPNAQTTLSGATTIHQRFFGQSAPVSAASLRSDLLGLAALYKPALILAPSNDAADPASAATGVQATYAARKADLQIETLP